MSLFISQESLESRSFLSLRSVYVHQVITIIRWCIEWILKWTLWAFKLSKHHTSLLDKRTHFHCFSFRYDIYIELDLVYRLNFNEMKLFFSILQAPMGIFDFVMSFNRSNLELRCLGLSNGSDSIWSWAHL